MRASGKIVGLLVFSLLWLWGADGRASSCRSIDGFLKSLNAGSVPPANEFNISSCNNEYKTDLVNALDAFIAKEPDPSDIDSVVRTIREAHRAGNRPTVFKEVALELQDKLRQGGLSFDPPSSPPADSFSLLDSLSELGKKERAGQEPGDQGSPAKVPGGAAQDEDEVVADISESEESFAIKYALPWFVILTLLTVGFGASVLVPVVKSFGVRRKEAETARLDEKRRREEANAVAQKVDPLQSLSERISKLETMMASRKLESECLENWGGQVNQALDHINAKIDRLESRLVEVEARPSMPQTIQGPNLLQVLQKVAALENAVRVLQEPQLPPARDEKLPTASSSLVPLEREVLCETWKKFQDNKEIMAALENARDKRWTDIRDPLLFVLPQTVPEDLKATFDTVVAPAKDFHNLVTKISLVPRLVSDDLPSLPSEAKELMRLRELSGLLTIAQSSNLVADRLNFRLERWVADQFLSFADLFLQRYQQARVERREAPLEPGFQIVREVLKIADLEPVDLTLGETPFDSTRHIGRSTASDPSFGSGVIVGVIRNGFIRGQQVIRQPEVIVNRVG